MNSLDLIRDRPINAALLKFMHGDQLIGERIHTERYGSWPGGIAIILEITPDPGTPEIVFQVRHCNWPGNTDCDSEIGIFEHEQVILI